MPYANDTISKDPDSDLDYGAAWAKFLAMVPGDTIESSVWIVPPNTLEEHDDSIDGAITRVWFRGGVLGETYVIVNRVTTSQGRIEDKTIYFRIEQH